MDNNSQSNIKKRSKKALIILLLCLLLVFLIPFLTVAATVALVDPVYKETFVGELGEKYDLLNSTDSKKIVFVGGSSLAFGLDSTLVKQHLSMEPVNLGLYANLGTKIMLDLSLSNINRGDVVIVAPEMNEQTLSLYFNAETAMQALDGNLHMLKSIDYDDYGSLVGALWGFTSAKLGYAISGERPENSGAYRKENFNSYGDNVFDRPYNVMSTVQKSISLDFNYDKSDGINTGYEEFIDYLNAYAKKIEERGADVYFSFPPMNAAALKDECTAERINGFYKNLARSLNFRIISNPHDYILDEGYFFDSEFHLNNAGVTVRTATLIDDIKREMGRTDITIATDDLPEPPGYAPLDFAAGDSKNLYFDLIPAKNGAGQDVWKIAGLNAEGMLQTSIIIPNNIDGIPVIGVEPYAFRGSEIRSLLVGDNVTYLASNSLSGAEHLESVYINKASPDAISVPNGADENGLITDGKNPSLKIFIPAEGMELYKADYFWSDYTAYLRSKP